MVSVTRAGAGDQDIGARPRPAADLRAAPLFRRQLQPAARRGASVRLAHVTDAPSAAAVRAASPAIAPAPTTSTRRPSSAPNSSVRSRYAAVTERTASRADAGFRCGPACRLWIACWNKAVEDGADGLMGLAEGQCALTCPRIWLSPITSDSSPDGNRERVGDRTLVEEDRTQ